MDRILLRGVSCSCRIGVPEEERASPQEIRLDVALELDVRRAAAKDDLRLAVDYHRLERGLRAAAEASRFKLLESLAERLAAEALRLAPQARSVTLAARKRPAVMPKTEEVVVEVVRRRTGGGR
jgi:7,8-dihydroneopterin aldolase/epimerase/oxygenase